MDDSELLGLRRFTLTCALIVGSWALAGVSLDPSAAVPVMGFSFRIAHPELLPSGLALGAVYGLVRYYYYAMMLRSSPYRIRRDLLDALTPESTVLVKRRRIPMYWGPTTFQTKTWHSEHEETDTIAQNIVEAFPKFVRARVKTTRTWRQGITQEGDEYTSFGLTVEIPVRCRMAAAFQDLDYSSAVWLPIAAVVTYAIRAGSAS